MLVDAGGGFASFLKSLRGKNTRAQALETAQWVKALAANLRDLSTIPRTHMIDEAWFLQVVL